MDQQDRADNAAEEKQYAILRVSGGAAFVAAGTANLRCNQAAAALTTSKMGSTVHRVMGTCKTPSQKML